MAVITHASLCNSIATTLGAAASLRRTQSFDELTEGMNTLPTLQVYPSNWNMDDRSGVSQSTFRGGVKRSLNIYNADVYVRRRSDLPTDVAKTVEVADELDAIFVAQNTKPYFGDDNIAQFHWEGSQVTLIYGEPEVKYSGLRYIITLWVL